MHLHQFSTSVALQLPEVTCSQPFGEGCDVYKAMEKVFMLHFQLQGKAAINLKVQPDHGSMLRDIYPYIRTGWHMNKQHWISVYDCHEIDEPLVKDLIQHSYRLVVSKLKKAEQQQIQCLMGI